MLDNLRNDSSQSPFFQEDLPEEEEEKATRKTASGRPFLGMTPAQRFIIVLFLFMMVCVTGAFFLAITGKMF